MPQTCCTEESSTTQEKQSTIRDGARIGRGKLSFKRKIFNSTINNWLVAASIVAIPSGVGALYSIWTQSIVKYKWINTMLTLVIIVIILFTYFRFYYDKINQKKRTNADKYYKILIDSGIEDINKLININMKTVGSNRYKKVFSPANPFNNDHSHLSPEEHLNAYLCRLKNTLYDGFDMAEEDVEINLYMADPVTEKWTPLFSPSAAQRDLELHKIIENGVPSTFNYVRSIAGIKYFMTKEQAYKEGHYLPTDRERRDNYMPGSIYCSNISLVDITGVVYPLLFCIATYKNPICPDNDIFARDRAERLFLKIETDIKYEYSKILLYCHMGLRDKIKDVI